MAHNEYYPEEVLVEKVQAGEYGWLDYVNHFSAEWQDEYARYCEKRGLMVGEESAAEFVRYKDDQLIIKCHKRISYLVEALFRILFISPERNIFRQKSEINKLQIGRAHV